MHENSFHSKTCTLIQAFVSFSEPYLFIMARPGARLPVLGRSQYHSQYKFRFLWKSTDTSSLDGGINSGNGFLSHSHARKDDSQLHALQSQVLLPWSTFEKCPGCVVLHLRNIWGLSIVDPCTLGITNCGYGFFS